TLAVRRDPSPLGAVCAIATVPHGQAVAFPDLVFQCDPKIREGGEQASECRTERPRAADLQTCVVNQRIRGENLLEGSEVAAMEHFLDEAAEQRAVRFQKHVRPPWSVAARSLSDATHSVERAYARDDAQT